MALHSSCVDEGSQNLANSVVKLRIAVVTNIHAVPLFIFPVPFHILIGCCLVNMHIACDHTKKINCLLFQSHMQLTKTK